MLLYKPTPRSDKRRRNELHFVYWRFFLLVYEITSIDRNKSCLAKILILNTSIVEGERNIF